MNNYSSHAASYRYVAIALAENHQEEFPFELSPTFLKELSHYRVLLNEVYGTSFQQQKQICFLAEGLLGAALYYKAIDLQIALKDLIYASSRQEAGQSLLMKVNNEIDTLLKEI